MSGEYGGGFKWTLDERRIYIVRRKADGLRYKIHHDGREELIDENAERRATAVDEPEVTKAKEK